VVGSGAGKINREDIAAIVDKFLAGRQPEETSRGTSESRQQPPRTSAEPEAEAGSMYAGPSHSQGQSQRQTENAGQAGNWGRSTSASSSASSTANAAGSSVTGVNGKTPVDFVSEDDVKRAIQKGEKIYINARTIITPAARDIGEPAEVFAKT
jgi:hypothetical protein